MRMLTTMAVLALATPALAQSNADTRGMSADARELMQCAGYVAQMRTNGYLPADHAERLDSLEERFARASDRLSGADMSRSSWFQEGSEGAKAHMRRGILEEVRSRIRGCRQTAERWGS